MTPVPGLNGAGGGGGSAPSPFRTPFPNPGAYGGGIGGGVPQRGVGGGLVPGAGAPPGMQQSIGSNNPQQQQQQQLHAAQNRMPSPAGFSRGGAGGRNSFPYTVPTLEEQQRQFFVSTRGNNIRTRQRR